MSAGCYSYLPVETLPAPGDESRVRLTDLGSATLAPRIGVGIIALRGRIESMDAESITIAVVGVTNRQELEDPWLGERGVVPRQFVIGFERRHLSKGRTALLSGGLILGSIALISGITGGDLAGGRLFGGETRR